MQVVMLAVGGLEGSRWRQADVRATLTLAVMLFQVEGPIHRRIADQSLLRNPARRLGLPTADHQSGRLTRQCRVGIYQEVENSAHPSRLQRLFHLQEFRVCVS